ncbi:MAG: LacI family DNA-binding transcriptional regulator [Betaproteobacteria bacterium]
MTHGDSSKSRTGFKVMATSKEISKRANVSAATVSHVINNTRYVSDEVRARVDAAVAALGYVPNGIAQPAHAGHPTK